MSLDLCFKQLHVVHIEGFLFLVRHFPVRHFPVLQIPVTPATLYTLEWKWAEKQFSSPGVSTIDTD